MLTAKFLSDGGPNLPGRRATNAGFNLVRWIMVVTLGCSLGLLLIFVVLATRPIPKDTVALPAIRRARVQEPVFELSNETMEGELRRVIESQLAAFRRNDFPRAYTYAADSLKDQISLPAFERMVRSGYPLLTRSRSAQFGAMLDNGEQAVVNVTVVGASGHMRHYRYMLLREGVNWRIFGVTEVNFAGMTI